MQNFTIEEFKKIHQAWKESGLSVRDYCANTGIKESRYMIDNNPIENCVRPLAIGRKNYMFLFGEEGDEAFLPCDYVRRYEDGKDAELPQHAA